MNTKIRRMLMAGLAAGAVSGAVAESAQSFECAKVTTPVEKMICADRDLARLDVELARAFADARRQIEAVADIGQPTWLKSVRNQCATVDCLKKAYEARIVYLRNVRPAAPFSLDGLAGEWSRVGSTQHEHATFTITTVTADGFDFDLFAANGLHVGQIEGSAARKAGRAVYLDQESKCRLTFSRKGPRVVLETSRECLGMGGMGVTFDGEFSIGEKRAPPPTLTELDVLAKGVPESAFSALVGDSYGEFLLSFQLIGTEKDLDGLGMKVVTGSVRGLGMLAIVMSRPDGKILAATNDRDSDTISYFSNDSTFSAKLPATIEEWRMNYGQKRVIFASVPK